MEDLIKRADVTEAFAELYDVFDDYPNIIKELHKVYDKILDITSAEKQGEWILGTNTYYKCSSCQYPFGKKYYNYCPNCGARMSK